MSSIKSREVSLETAISRLLKSACHAKNTSRLVEKFTSQQFPEVWKDFEKLAWVCQTRNVPEWDRFKREEVNKKIKEEAQISNLLQVMQEISSLS